MESNTTKKVKIFSSLLLQSALKFKIVLIWVLNVLRFQTAFSHTIFTIITANCLVYSVFIVSADPNMAEIDRLGENIEEFVQFGFDEQDPYFLHCISLNLHCNRLTHLHGLPKKLSSLTELNLSSNEFISCDLPELAFLSCLKTLDLSANRIESLASLPFLPTLTTLSIAYNNLTTFDGLEENTPNLTTLDARGNFVSERYDVFALPALLQLGTLVTTEPPTDPFPTASTPTSTDCFPIRECMMFLYSSFFFCFWFIHQWNCNC